MLDLITDPAALPAMPQGDGAYAKPVDSDIRREVGDVPQARKELVEQWCKDIKEAKKYWEPVFKQMRRDSRFAAGKQWGNSAAQSIVKDERYVANLTLNHIGHRTASLYAKNPRVKASRRQKLWSTVWDGTDEQLAAAQAAVAYPQTLAQYPQQLAMSAASGQPPAPPPQPPTMDPEMAMAILQDFEQVESQRKLYAKMGRSLEFVVQYSMDEPIPKFKEQAKQAVRRALTCKVAFAKLGYQRIMEQTPDVDAKINDATDRLAEIEVLAADLQDKKIEPESMEAQDLKQQLADLQKQKEIVLREGLVFGWPEAWSIICDTAVKQLKGFIGAEWVVQEYQFTPKMVKKLYKIDLGNNYQSHTAEELAMRYSGNKPSRKKEKFAMVYEIYDLVSQQCFTICLGYPDYLKEPGAPDVALEQFHPFYTLSFNDIEGDGETPDGVYPPSNVELIEHMQTEYNYGREGLKTHQRANIPGYVSAKGVLGDNDKTVLSTHEPHEIIELGINKNDDIKKILAAKPTIPIDPALYSVDHLYADIQRVLGDSAENLGGTSPGTTATAISVSENSRVTTLQSNIDDLDGFLTDLMRGAAQVLLLNMSKETAMEIAGPGAAWPDMPPTRKEVARELNLDIKAGSSGKPNRQAQLAVVEKVMPFLMQIPGLKPQKILELVLEIMDEGIDFEDFMDHKLPSIVAMNSMAKPNLAAGPGNEAQAPAGSLTTGGPPQPSNKAQNMYPAPHATPGDAALTTH